METMENSGFALFCCTWCIGTFQKKPGGHIRYAPQGSHSPYSGWWVVVQGGGYLGNGGNG